MKRFLVLFYIIYFVHGATYNDLRVKFGWSDALENKEYFFKIPRTIKDAESQGWKRTERPPGPIPELRLYCSQGRYVCPLYDPSGFIAGLQLALPIDSFENPENIKQEKKFVKWQAPALDGEPAKEYYTVTQYYVSEESLKAGAGPQVQNGATLQDDGVWVNDPNGKLFRIPIPETEIKNTPYKKQNCIPNMGTHYYYNMTPDLKCEDSFPWFVLTNGGVMVGTGFFAFGRFTPPQNHRDWFENLPAGSGKAAIPLGPTCLEEFGSKHGVITLHIYYVDQPWNIRCADGDSIKPVPALDRIAVTGQRYGRQILDEIKSAFIG